MANRFLNNITINDAYTLPSSDGTNGQAITTDGSGNLSFTTLGDGEIVKIHCKNTSGSAITKGTPVYITGNVGNSDRLEIAPADASDAAKMPAVGVLETDLSNNGQGDIVVNGYLKGLATDTIDGTSGSSNDTVYVKAGGGLTLTKPTGTNYIQNIAKIARVHGSSGSIVVSSIMRTNDVPAPLYVDIPNGRVGVGTASPSRQFVVENNSGDAYAAINCDSNSASYLLLGPTDDDDMGKIEYDSDQRQMLFHSDGDQVLKITDNNSVGINLGSLDSPDRALHVKDTSSGVATFESTLSSSKIGLKNSSGTHNIEANGSTLRFDIFGVEKMRIDSSGKVGIGQSSPDVSLDISATDAVQMPAGTTAQRPTGEAGMFRYNSEEGQFEGYTTEWGAIAGGGGDTGTVTIEKNVYTGDGSDTTFDTTSTIADERNVQVYIDGIYQSKDNYNTSGSTVTFSTAPPNGVSVELIHIVAITGQTSLDKFTGDGSTTAFNLSQTIDSENNVQVYIDGVYQSKDNYSTSGNTLTFTTAPANNQAIEAVHIKAVDVSAMNSDQFTGDGSTTAFSLTNTPSSEDKTLVFVQGVYQEKSTYSISGTTLTFTTAPPNGYTVEVVVYSKITIADNTVNVERFTGDNSTVAFTLTNPPSAANNLDVYISGLYQEKNTYSFSGSTVTLDTAPVTGAVIECRSVANITGVTASSINDLRYSVDLISTNTNAVVGKLYVLTGNCTLTLPASPNTGDSIKISNRSGVATAVIARNGNKIMGDASDLTIDKLNAGFEMIYSGSAQGWVLIGVPGQ